MKKYIITLFTLMIFTSCDIDLQPDSELVHEGYWKTEEAVRANHSGVYAKFRDFHETFWKMGELRSDIWGGKTQESAYDVDLVENNMSTSIVPFEKWGNLYGLLHYVNDFIANAPKVSFSKEADLKHMMGQMYGLRAYIYFTMLKTWGKVPLTEAPIPAVVEDISALKKERAPQSEVLDLIKSDIEKSLEFFGSNNTLWAGKRVYWSKAATLTLKGEVYIWSGKVKNGGTADFQTAKDALTAVTGYSLVDDWSTELWGAKNQNNREFIFCVDYQVNQKESFYNGNFTGQPRNINPTYNSKGEPMEGFNSTGQNRYGPSDKLVELFQSSPNDVRANETFIFLYKDNNGGSGYSTFNKDKYNGAILKKFLGEIVDGNRHSFTNIPIYRYADVLLLLAEAKNHLGEDPSEEINQIRRRAYGTHYQAYTNQSKEENAKAILDERLREFVGEGKRWWDLLRAGDNYIFNEVATMQGKETKIYLPITQDMLNNDSALRQTEGYE